MATVAVSSFWIHQIRLVGPWSPIHLLSIFTLITLPLGVWKAHRHDVADHRRIMILLFSGALVIAGLFTLLPGRIMHAVVFGHDILRRTPFGGPVLSAESGPAGDVPMAGSNGDFGTCGEDRRQPRKSLEKRREKAAGGNRLGVV